MADKITYSTTFGKISETGVLTTGEGSGNSDIAGLSLPELNRRVLTMIGYTVMEATPLVYRAYKDQGMLKNLYARSRYEMWNDVLPKPAVDHAALEEVYSWLHGVGKEDHFIRELENVIPGCMSQHSFGILLLLRATPADICRAALAAGEKGGGDE